MKSSVGFLLSLAITALVPLSSAIPAPADAQVTPPLQGGNPCYTHTTTLDQPGCPQMTCTVKPCMSITTSTTPCPTLSCPQTPTVTEFKPCPTACRTGCASSTTYVTPTLCPL